MIHVFADSGGWIGLLRRDDADHKACLARYRELSANGIRLITSNCVVDETATRLRYDAGLSAALSFRAILREAEGSNRLRVEWIGERLEDEAWQILEQYPSLSLSLTDATSAAVARKQGITEIFGLDRHFEALGFTVLPG